MNWIKKLFTGRLYSGDDLFSARIAEALGALKSGTEEFVTGVQDYAMEKEMTELRERIARLEAVILPMRNGSLTKQP